MSTRKTIEVHEFIKVGRVEKYLGAEIIIDPRIQWLEKDKSYLQYLLYNFKVLIIKNQNLNDKELKKLASNFGDFFTTNKANPTLGSVDNSSPVVIVGNKADEFELSYLGNQEVLPHSDHQWLEKPSSVSLLYALDIHNGAAPTIWYDMEKIYDALPTDIKNKINPLKILTYNPFFRPFGSVSAKYVDRYLDVPQGETYDHPLVRTHPFTDRKSLYLHKAYEMEFIGLSVKEGKQLMKFLHKHIEELPFKYVHQWKNNDIVIWDNRSTIHYRPTFNENIRRVLKRISIAGEKPF